MKIWKKYTLDENYLISSYGDVYSLYSNRLLKPSVIKNTKGYLSYTLAGKTTPIHRIVATLFVDNPENLAQVHHIDNDPTNNRADNLMWISARDNLSEMRGRLGDTSAIAREALKKVSGKKVDKYSLDGTLLDSYSSVTDAVNKNPGTLASKIGQVANGQRKTHAGYVWAWNDKSQANRSRSHK